MKSGASLLSVALITLTSSSCAGDIQSGSQVSHALGDNRQSRTEPLKPCDNARLERQKEVIPKTISYLNHMFNFITSKVQETGGEVFQGFLEPKSFCIFIGTHKSRYRVAQATANSEKGEIKFSIPMFVKARNDTSFAAIMSHELAHITLHHAEAQKHTFRLANPSIQKQLQEIEQKTMQVNQQGLRLSEEFVALSEANIEKLEDFEDSNPSFNLDLVLEDLNNTSEKKETVQKLEQHMQDSELSCEKCKSLKKVASELDTLKLRKQALSQQKQKITSEVLKETYSEEDLKNKKEKDADDVGLEFYARAGFELSGYSEMNLLFAEMKKPGSSSRCLKRRKEDVERGTRSHPTSCWRALSSMSEVELHLIEYQKWTQGITELSPLISGMPSLAEVRAELKALVERIEVKIEAEELELIPKDVLIKRKWLSIEELLK